MFGLSIATDGDNREVRVARPDGTPILTHRIPRDARPSIHPITAPDGVGILTEDRPAHHPWQQGLYTGFNLVNGIGFWRNEPQDGSFSPRLGGRPSVEGGVARWTLENMWRHPDGTPMIGETQDWSLTAGERTYTIDMSWGLRAETDIEIGEFMAGGLFLRMPYAPERGAAAVNSEGRENDAAEKQRARWTAVSMPIEGRQDDAGMAIMDHPSNPAHPTTWRVDREFGISPSRVIGGSWRIARGATDRYRYRILVFCGEVDRAAIEESWKDFVKH